MKPPLTPTGVRRKMQQIHKRVKGAELLQRALAQEIAVTRLDIQLRCPHDWHYHPDPSGNNDSYYSCDLCDQERRRL